MDKPFAFEAIFFGMHGADASYCRDPGGANATCRRAFEREERLLGWRPVIGPQRCIDVTAWSPDRDRLVRGLYALSRYDPKDPFRSHRLALSVVGPNLGAPDLSSILRGVTASDASSFTGFLFKCGLASYWHNIVAQDAVGKTTTGFINALRSERLVEAAFYLRQKAALRELDGLFDSKNIIYAAMKGAHVREIVYEDPALRPANDIDILISPDQRDAAARALTGAGFELNADAGNVSHEATFTRDSLVIDLHWDILRPGRTRSEMTQPMLSRRQRLGDFWGLNDTDTVFLMLVHPAFAKYVCSPNMGLIRVVDFILWLHKRPVDWDAVAERLDETGLKVAAWAVLKWFAMLLKPESMPVPRTFIARIRSGRLRSRYLVYCLQNDLPTRWLHKPLVVQLGLTLLLHDRPSDAHRAISGWMRARRTREWDPFRQVTG